MKGSGTTSRMRFSRRLTRVRKWLLEDKALEGLGGPPNNWQHSPNYSCRQYGMSLGHEWWAIRFTNDAFNLCIDTQYTDEIRSKIKLMISTDDFRKLAVWYLWRWAWGEWFGLRRTLYYWDLDRRLSKRQEEQKP